MKKLVNSLRIKILFRCDAGKVSEIGTGHLYRSIAIAKILKKKYSIKKNQIVFITKNQNKYNISIKILDKFKFKYMIYPDRYLNENTFSEINILKKNPANILIIDRLENTKIKTLILLKKNFSKVILIDSIPKQSNLCDLSLNSLVHRNKKTINNCKIFDNLILPSYNHKSLIKNNKLTKQIAKNIFIFFGGFDKNSFTRIIIRKIVELKLPLNIFVSNEFAKLIKNIKINNLRVSFFNQKNFYKYLSKADISIVSGGLTLFDSLFFGVPALCLPQYKHQLINAKIINKLNANRIINSNRDKISNSFIKNFRLIYKDKKIREMLIKNGNKIINLNKMNKVLDRIYKIYENEVN